MSAIDKSITVIRNKMDSRIATREYPTERAILAVLLILMYAAYGALGRPLFFNHMYVGYKAVLNDPIGAVLPYIRLALCLISVLTVALATDIRWSFSKIPWMLAPFCALAFASAIWSDDPKEVVRSALMTTCMWVALSMIIHRLGLETSTRVSLHVIAIVCIVSTAVAVVYPSIGRHSGLEASQTSHIGEWRGIFDHKNGLGPWAAWGSIFLVTHAKLSSRLRLYWFVAWLCSITCLIMSNSATGVIMALMMLMVWMFFLLLRHVRAQIVVAALIGVSVVAVFFVWLGGETIFDLFGRDATLTGRTAIWSIAIDYFWQRPLLGGGFQRLGGDELMATTYSMFGQALGPENGYLALLLDLGIVGFILFFVPYFLAIRNGFEWLKHVIYIDRLCLEMQLMILIGSLVSSFTVADIMVSTGYDGVFNFTALFALLTTPKSPEGIFRGEYRLAKYRIDQARRSRRRAS